MKRKIWLAVLWLCIQSHAHPIDTVSAQLQKRIIECFQGHKKDFGYPYDTIHVQKGTPPNIKQWNTVVWWSEWDGTIYINKDIDEQIIMNHTIEHEIVHSRSPKEYQKPKVTLSLQGNTVVWVKWFSLQLQHPQTGMYARFYQLEEATAEYIAAKRSRAIDLRSSSEYFALQYFLTRLDNLWFITPQGVIQAYDKSDITYRRTVFNLSNDNDRLTKVAKIVTTVEKYWYKENGEQERDFVIITNRVNDLINRMTQNK